MYGKYDNMPIEELKAEAKDIIGAIRNEAIWMIGGDEEMHKHNIEMLREELEYVMEIITGG